MCCMTVYIKKGYEREAQECVKKSKGRFQCNPLKLWANYEFKIEFDRVEDMNIFDKMLTERELCSCS